MGKAQKTKRLLHGARVYLSGPMDFVASREDEKRFGWRNRVGQFLRKQGAVVFDPWDKPEVRGFHEYGREGVDTTDAREGWTFEDTPGGAETRARISGKFWETLHIDLRMVDTSDFTIAYCPTNIYSVGTVHEIVLCRQQRKPVLFVSPRVSFPTLDKLRGRLRGDPEGLALLDTLATEIPIKPNADGVPSLWYMPLVGGESFFDSFGFARYREEYGWDRIPLDDRDEAADLKRPLLPFLERVNENLPEKWDNRTKRYVRNDDWLLWDFAKPNGSGPNVAWAHRDST